MTRRAIAIVGAGPAGLMAAERLASEGYKVVVFEAMPSPGRKLLMAGRGGLNLTHAEPYDVFLTRYGKAMPPALRMALDAFPPSALIAWANRLGVETFVGTSGRIFPKAMKASPLLRAWLRRLEGLGVELRTRQRWTGWDEAGDLLFADETGRQSTFPAAASLLALGGASWPRLGSDGRWAATLSDAGVAITPLAPANAGTCIAWSEHMRSRFAGQPLKRIAVEFAGVSRRGEAMITRDGLEGGIIYSFTPDIRDALASDRDATLRIDLRPDLGFDELARRIGAAQGKQSLANVMRKSAGLAPQAIALIREAYPGPQRSGAEDLARRIKDVALPVRGVCGIERAISTAGGVCFEAIDDHFMLRARPGTFVAGEMLDWEAPTGGYLLQAVFASGVAAAAGVSRWLVRSERPRP